MDMALVGDESSFSLVAKLEANQIRRPVSFTQSDVLIKSLISLRNLSSAKRSKVQRRRERAPVLFDLARLTSCSISLRDPDTILFRLVEGKKLPSQNLYFIRLALRGEG